MSSSHLNGAKHFEQVFFARLAGIIEGQVPTCKQSGFAIAYSGGLDSSVLLKLAYRFAKQENIPLFAFHIHHGLSPNADVWLRHCHDVCLAEGIRFRSVRVAVDSRGMGIESAARSLRYAALGKLCADDQIPLLLTAHHLDDQAETMLMQLLRGTGVRGLAGMDHFNHAASLLENADLLLARPLLQETKQALVRYAQSSGLAHIEDESNTSTCYTRNALRLLVMPEIEKIAPDFSERLLRTSEHVRSANRILDEIAEQDLAVCRDGSDLKIAALSALSTDRVTNLFRYWLLKHGLQLPSASKLREMQTQLFEAREDARVTVPHLNHVLHRYDNKVSLQDTNCISQFVGVLWHQWNGEESHYFPELKGRLLFKSDEIGIDAEVLLKSKLEIRQRVGGERLRLGKMRPSRDIKSHFQTLRIPFWRREKLPYIYIDNRLFYVGLVGTDAAFLCESPSTNKVRLTWLPDQTSVSV
ncbi:tRNA lysidine(34) synthetase TilS [Undibacterium sp. Di24W]|uniref:tRNA lysidine(34) synthetase TilS n=1 Tax=Undibacterium sp. Di24W TaxID=3413033 RepID=UPI003BF421D0